MPSLDIIHCKDCGTPFPYDSIARERDALAGRSAPERCAVHRRLHRREYARVGCSHTDVVRVRETGTGGLTQYHRVREPTSTIQTTPPAGIDERFPINEVIPALLHNLVKGREQVHVVVGPTGSGKSTWLPLCLLRNEELLRRGPICVTQPRIPAVEGPAEYVASLYYGAITAQGQSPAAGGRLIGPGFAVGIKHSKVGTSMSDAANRLIFLTDGTLLNEVVTGTVRRYSVVMIDEAHERSVNIDLILGLLKARLSAWPQLKVIVASATVEADTFKNFFGPGNTRLYESKGFTYPILQVWADESAVPAPIPSADFAPVPDVEVEARWLHPAPVLRSLALQDRARYYPDFGALVVQGTLSAADISALKASNSGLDGWAEAVDLAARESARNRVIGGRDQPITDSIRGLVESGQGGPVCVQAAHRKRMIDAAIHEIERLCLRDSEEAPRRQSRWARRGGLWPQLEQPAGRGHILVFFPTAGDIDDAHEKLTARVADFAGTNTLHRFHRNASDAEKQLATSEPLNPAERKIVLATNLAETSLTLPGVTYVLDTGLICESQYNPATQEKQLPTILHSQAGCRQRLGRVGRKEPGEGWRLYTRSELRIHQTYTTEEIARSGAESVLLKLASAGVPPGDVARLLLTAPRSQAIQKAKKALEQVGALDCDGDLTHHGEELESLSVERLEHASLLVEADRWACLWEMAVFLAFTGLPRRPLPGPLGRTLALWDPAADAVWDDEAAGSPPIGEPAEEAVAVGTGADDSPWFDPGWRLDVTLRQRALYGSALDDLELYLRIWQGWASQPSEADRRRWARCHGVSHGALEAVRRRVGVARRDAPTTSGQVAAEDQGYLRSFLPVREKGEFWRDIAFELLDRVRYLYAAIVPTAVFRVVGGVPVDDVGMQLGVAGESVWGRDAGSPRREGCAVELTRVSATLRVTEIQHVVWLDPAWFSGGQPTLPSARGSLGLSFAGALDRAVGFLGSGRLRTGPALADLPALPTNPVSPDLPGLRAAANSPIVPWRGSAHLLAVALRPGRGQGSGLVRTASGLEVGFAIDQDLRGLVANGHVQVVVRKDDKLGILVARVSASPAGVEHPPNVAALPARGGAGPVHLRQPAPPPPCPPAPLRPPTPPQVTVAEGFGRLRVGAEYEGAVADVRVAPGFRGFLVGLDEVAGVRLPVDRWLRAATIRNEATLERRCRVRMREERRPELVLVEWLEGDRRSPLTARDDLAPGEEFKAVIIAVQVRGGMRGYTAKIQVEPNWSPIWWVPARGVGDGDAGVETRVQVVVGGGGGAIPFLRHIWPVAR